MSRWADWEEILPSNTAPKFPADDAHKALTEQEITDARISDLFVTIDRNINFIHESASLHLGKQDGSFTGKYAYKEAQFWNSS